MSPCPFPTTVTITPRYYVNTLSLARTWFDDPVTWLTDYSVKLKESEKGYVPRGVRGVMVIVSYMVHLENKRSSIIRDTVKLHLKIDPVSYPARAEGLVYIYIYI